MWNIQSLAPASVAKLKTFSSSISPLSIFITPSWRKLCDAEPCVPSPPPFFWKIVLKLDAVLFLLSVKVVITIAVFAGPNP